MLVGRSASAFRSRSLDGISGVRANGELHSYYGTLDKLSMRPFLSMYESLASMILYIIRFRVHLSFFLLERFQCGMLVANKEFLIAQKKSRRNCLFVASIPH